MKPLWLLPILLTAILLAGCATNNPTPVAENEGEAYTLITAAELVELMNEQRDSFLLVNTHIPFEGNLPTTDFSVPYNEIAQHLGQFPTDKDADIVLYCMSNRMAYIAADILVQAGYTNLMLLDGGMLAWHSAGLPLVTTP